MSSFSRRDFMMKIPLAAAVAASPMGLQADATAEEIHDGVVGPTPGARQSSSPSSPFTLEALMNPKVRDTYEGDFLDRVAFPMGGIGTGCVSLAGSGKLIDWEIFNNPNRGYQPYFSFLSVWAQQEGGQPKFRVLEQQLRGSLEGPYYLTKTMWPDGNGCGPLPTEAVGLPRMRECKFVGRFPFAQVELSDSALPVTAKIEGWSPFIPGNAKDSSMPVAMLHVTLHNPGSKRVKAAIALNVQNCAGKMNEMVQEDGFAALHLHEGKDGENAMFIASPETPSSWQLNWTGSMVFMEAASTQLAILRSPTVIRYPDGTIYGWEGCATNRRLGYGTCNHVWNYQQAIPYLFPDLQRSILDNFYTNSFQESDGAIQFRVPAGPGAQASAMPPLYQAPFGAPGADGKTNFFSAADGQFGMIAQVYRDWHISGDTEWLAKVWPRVKKSLEFAWTGWDPKRVGMLEGSHHNTLDLNFTTPETMCGSEYQAALLAGEKMAMAMKDHEAADEFRRVYESGKSLTDKELFNGEYYQQKTPAPGSYQLGAGCISDQVTGQLYSRMLDLEDVYDREHIHTALQNLFRYNYRSSFEDVVNTDRGYSLNDDRGLMIATWPKGGRPEMPLLYCYETMPGFEYQVAFNLLYAGQMHEGLTLIQSVRDRFDGKKRNPFCEFEWGNHYARSMITYTGMLALARFRYSGVEKSLQLAPQVHEQDFRQFFSVGSGWGVVSQKLSGTTQTITVTVAKGSLEVSQFRVKCATPAHAVVASCNGVEVTGRDSGILTSGSRHERLSNIMLEKSVIAKPGSPIRLELKLA